MSGDARPTSGKGRGGNRGRGGRGGGRGGEPNSKPSGASSGRGNRRNRSGRGGASAAEKKAAAEQKKRDAEAAAAAAAAAKAEEARLAEIERRQLLQTEYNNSIKNAITTLESFASAAKLHENLRRQLDPQPIAAGENSALDEARHSFEKSKKSLKSDLKKCTAFVKKIKSGSYHTPAELNGPNNPIRTLNLTRYVEEVAAALTEPQTKVKQSDIPGIVMLCVEMHRRYETFSQSLIPALYAGVTGSGGNSDGEALPRRICLRLLTEFVIHGIITDLKPLVKVINEAAGIPTEKGKDYAVADANLIVTFSKAGGHEILGCVPRSVRLDCELLQNEISGKGKGNLSLSEGDNNTEESPSIKVAADSETPFVPTLSASLVEKAKVAIEDFTSTAPNSRAVPSNMTTNLHTHSLGVYHTLAKSYVATHRRLQKLEKRCEQDRLLQGNLSEAREKGLKDAKSLMESLTKSVESLSEVLDEDIPPLVEEEVVEEATDGKGIELWTKGESGSAERLGPFDDEETRSFYCDVPDFLSTKPHALLGISEADVERQKEKNKRQYGEDEEVEMAEMSVEVEDTLPMVEEEAEEDENNEDEGDDVVMEEGNDSKEDKEENKEDTPHFKLMVLLEQDLPEASRREKIDEIADKFCANHGSNKKSRKRLYETLFLVPRARLDLLPYYSRFAAIMDRVYSDSTLVTELEQQMHGQARFKKNQNLDSRLRTARYIGELTKFRVAPPIVALRGIRRCLEDFNGYNIDVACCLLESCGRYLFRTKHTHKKLAELMDTMMRLKKARNLDERSIAMINSAFFMVNPPPQSSRPEKEVPPLEAYLRYLLASTLEADEKSVSFVSKQIQRLPWSDPGIDCGGLVCKYMLKACRKGRYKSTKAVALLVANLKRSKPEVPSRLIDAILEDIQWFMEHPNFRDNQRTIVCARLFGELYCSGVLPSSIIFEQIDHILNFGHEIPMALREASQNEQLFAPRGNVSQTILEDEELEEEEEEGGDETDKENIAPTAVPVSSFSKYDPRVPCETDPPMAVFRIKLVCTILDAISPQVSAGNKSKVDFALASLQRYLFTKTSLTSDVEFSVLDLFDTLDSQLKKSSSSKKKAQSVSFHRHNTWLEAHNYVISAEKAKCLDDARTKTRLLVQAGIMGTENSSGDIDGDLLEDDLDSMDMSDDDERSSDGESDDESVAGSVESSDKEADDECDNDDSESDNESEDDSDDDEDDFDHEAYMRQLQDEAFESELRKLTNEALEKGKISARTGAGAKVSSQMPAAPQFLAKKATTEDNEGDKQEDVPFGGGEGMSFKLLKRGNKGKMEEKRFVVPKSTNLARVATKVDDEAAKEHDLLKAKVLQYEADSADAGGNVYLDETKLEKNRNRKLTMETLDKNFGKSKPEAPYKLSERFRARSQITPGRGRGGGRLFNPGRGRG